MKRSRVNALIQEANQFLKQHQFYLPPFAYWSPDDWQSKGEEVYEIFERRLGWDITDFGEDRFEDLGLVMFTIRNGEKDNPNDKNYCEKVLLVGADQITPMHFHWHKMEDIINRGGGNLVIQLYNATQDGKFANTDVVVTMDGVQRTVKAGETIVLTPGESVTLVPYVYHKFWGAEGRVLAGEVSKVNDDYTDNRFYEPIGRFSDIEEDEIPIHLLVNDYDTYYRLAK